MYVEPNLVKEIPSAPHRGRLLNSDGLALARGNQHVVRTVTKQSQVKSSQVKSSQVACECYREWLETGGDAYAIAVVRSFPIECVASGHGRINSADIEAEIGSLVEIVVELDKRLVLECGCAPKRCHLACIAEKCNELIRAKRAARSKQAADARDAGGVAAREQCGEVFECAGSDAADVGASDVASAGTGGEAFNTTDAVADVQTGVVCAAQAARAVARAACRRRPAWHALQTPSLSAAPSLRPKQPNSYFACSKRALACLHVASSRSSSPSPTLRARLELHTRRPFARLRRHPSC